MSAPDSGEAECVVAGCSCSPVQGDDVLAVHAENIYVQYPCRTCDQGDAVGVDFYGRINVVWSVEISRCSAFVIVVVDNFDFRNHFFGIFETAAKCVVLVGIEIPKCVRSGDKVVVKNGAGVTRCVVCNEYVGQHGTQEDRH